MATATCDMGKDSRGICPHKIIQRREGTSSHLRFDSTNVDWFHKHGSYGSIRERAERKGLRIDFDDAVQILLWQGTIFGQKNRMFVAIIIRNPPVPQSGPPAALRRPHEGHGIPVDTGNSPSPPRIDLPSQDHPQRKRQRTEKSLIRGSHANDKIAPNQQKEPEARQTGKEIDTKILQKQPEILTSTRLEPTVGSIIEIYEEDAVHAKTGFVAIIMIRYRVEKLMKDTENQDAGREGGLLSPGAIEPN